MANKKVENHALAETSIPLGELSKQKAILHDEYLSKSKELCSLKKENPEACERCHRSGSLHDFYKACAIHNTFVQEVDNFLRHWVVKADLPRMELTHSCSKTSIKILDTGY